MALAGIDSKLLTLDEYLIGNITFKVVFGFDDKGGLREVVLNPIGDLKTVPKLAYSNFESVLTRKYGKPSKVNRRQFREAIERSAEWWFPSTVIIRQLARPRRQPRSLHVS